MTELTVGDIVIIAAGEDWPEHLFRVDYVFDDCVGGYSITGPRQANTGNQTSS